MQFRLTAKEVAKLCAQHTCDENEVPDGDYRVETKFLTDGENLVECVVTWTDKRGEN